MEDNSYCIAHRHFQPQSLFYQRTRKQLFSRLVSPSRREEFTTQKTNHSLNKCYYYTIIVQSTTIHLNLIFNISFNSNNTKKNISEMFYKRKSLKKKIPEIDILLSQNNMSGTDRFEDEDSN